MSNHPPQRPLRWASWAAVSSEEQAEKISLDEQAAQNRAACDKHGGELVATLTVPGHTRYYALLEDAANEMEAYAQLRDLVKRRAFDVLVFRDITRLGRTAALCMAVAEVCRQANIALYPTADPPRTLDVLSGHSDMLIHAIHSVGAQEEVHRLRERHRFGMIGRVQKGENAGAAPYGYLLRYDEHGTSHLQIDEEAAAVVRSIFAWYLDGEGAPTIVKRLNAQGIPSPRGGEWVKHTVGQLIQRAWKYAGYSEINRHSRKGRPFAQAQGVWQPIISRDTAEKSYSEKAARIVNRRIAHQPYPFTGVCICGECGGGMAYGTHPPSKYRSRGRVYILCVRHRPRLSVRLEDIIDALTQSITDMEGLDIRGLVGDEGDPLEPYRARIAAQEGTHERLQAALSRAHRAYAMGRMTEEEYGALVDELRGQMKATEIEAVRAREAAESEAERGTRAERLESVCAAGLAMLESDDPVAANLFWRNHVRITVSRGSLRIHWL